MFVHVYLHMSWLISISILNLFDDTIFVAVAVAVVEMFAFETQPVPIWNWFSFYFLFSIDCRFDGKVFLHADAMHMNMFYFAQNKIYH